MEWCNSDSLKLIKLYRQQECLWNPNHNDYKNKIKKNDAWNEMSDVIKCDSTETKKKMESLLGSFRRERQKQEHSIKTGSGADVIFKSTWFAFKDMLFLLDKFATKETKNTEAEDEEIIAIYSDIVDSDQELNESEFNSTQQSAATSTQPSAPKATEVTIPKRKLVHESTNSSIIHSSKRVPANIPNARSEEAYQIRKGTVANCNPKDGSTIYGEYVSSKHRKYSTHAQSIVEHLIGNILFHADMGKYEPIVTPSVSPALTLHSPTVYDQHSLLTGSDNYSSNAPTPPTIYELHPNNYSSEPQQTLINFRNTFPSNQ